MIICSYFSTETYACITSVGAKALLNTRDWFRGSYGGDCAEYGPHTFPRNISPLSSGLNSKPSKKPAEAGSEPNMPASCFWRFLAELLVDSKNGGDVSFWNVGPSPNYMPFQPRIPSPPGK
jgi:hypothetical protein